MEGEAPAEPRVAPVGTTGVRSTRSSELMTSRVWGGLWDRKSCVSFLCCAPGLFQSGLPALWSETGHNRATSTAYSFLRSLSNWSMTFVSMKRASLKKSLSRSMKRTRVLRSFGSTSESKRT